MADRQYLEQLSRQLADNGKLIEAGWVALRLHAIPLDAPAAQLDDMRYAYMVGAQHLFSSMLSIMDPGLEETEADVRRMDLIHRELEAFRKEIELRAAQTKGRA